MPRSDRKKLLKIRLHSNGRDVETPFGEDLGPTNVPGARCVRLANIPFLYAKPTYGDVIVVEPGEGGMLTWNSKRPGRDSKPAIPIAEDGGRFLMILDYRANEAAHDSVTAFRVFVMTCETHDIIVEGCFGPKEELPGRVYIAAPRPMTVDSVMAMLDEANLPLDLTLIHPGDGDGDDEDDADDDDDAYWAELTAPEDEPPTRDDHGMNA